MKKIILTLTFLWASAACAQGPSWGERFYARDCSACHGEDAKGDGGLAALLTIEVPDLTTLSARNNGEFPLLYVIHVIDGRSGLRAHDQAMPYYGEIFDDEFIPHGIPGGAEAMIRGRVLSIAEYLLSIQQ